jgi:hypothetical protein
MSKCCETPTSRAGLIFDPQGLKINLPHYAEQWIVEAPCRGGSAISFFVAACGLFGSRAEFGHQVALR